MSQGATVNLTGETGPVESLDAEWRMETTMAENEGESPRSFRRAIRKDPFSLVLAPGRFFSLSLNTKTADCLLELRGQRESPAGVLSQHLNVTSHRQQLARPPHMYPTPHRDRAQTNVMHVEHCQGGGPRAYPNLGLTPSHISAL